MQDKFAYLGTRIEMLEELTIFDSTPTTWNEVDSMLEALKDTVDCLKDVYLGLKEVRGKLNNDSNS